MNWRIHFLKTTRISELLICESRLLHPSNEDGKKVFLKSDSHV